MFEKTDHAGFLKDTSAGMTINNNTEEYRMVLARRRKAVEHQDQKKEIEDIKSEVKDLKEMMAKILEAVTK